MKRLWLHILIGMLGGGMFAGAGSAYAYGLAGNRQTATITAGDQRLTQTAANGYGYDSLDRLITAAYPAGQSETFSLDLLGNRTSSPAGYTDRQGRQTSYTANNVNEYTSITSTGGGTQAPQYDPAGNLTANEYGYQFVYDHENRLIEVKDKDAGHATLASYTYDALGHRVKEIRGNQTTRYYYDGETVLAEYDGQNNLLRYHVNGPTYVDEHVLLHEKAHDQQPEGEYYYLLGTLYSVTGLVDANGAVVERYRYDAYGLPVCLGPAPTVRDFVQFQAAFSGNQPCSQAARIYDYNNDGQVDLTDYRFFFSGVKPGLALSPYRFTGQRLDWLRTDGSGKPVLVLYDYRVREYDALYGRFLETDPAGYADGMNLYEYVKSQPTMGADPSGKFGVAEISAAAALSLDLEGQNLNNVGVGLVGAIRGLADLVSDRNRVLSGIIGEAYSTPDMSGLDTALAAHEIWQQGQTVIMAGGFLYAGVHVATEGVGAIFSRGARQLNLFEEHHALPMFMGGRKNGLTTLLDEGAHRLEGSYHTQLIEHLAEKHIVRPSGYTWKQLFKETPGLKAKVWEEAVNFTWAYDEAEGTSILWPLLAQTAEQLEDLRK